MKRLILLLLLFTFLLSGCSKQEEKIVVQEEIINEAIFECPSSYIEFEENECCLDENNNSICDEIDFENNLKIEYDALIKEVNPKEDVIKVTVETNNKKIEAESKVKIYLKLKDEQEIKLEDLLIKINNIAGGKTMFYNKDLGDEIYEVRYISNKGVPTKQDYLSSKDLVEISFDAGNPIKESEYVYIKIVANSGLVIPIHINTPKDFKDNITIIYP